MTRSTAAGGAAVARRKDPRSFIGQVIEHLTESSLNVWALDEQGAYVAYGISPSDWPVGTVVSCRLVADGTYIDRLQSVDGSTREAYRSKLLIR